MWGVIWLCRVCITLMELVVVMVEMKLTSDSRDEIGSRGHLHQLYDGYY